MGHGLKGWEVTIRLNTGQRVKLTVVTYDVPLLTIAGDLPTFGALFDDEADRWDED